MHILPWALFAGLIAYCSDTALYGGIHADAMLQLARNVAHGVLLGLRQLA